MRLLTGTIRDIVTGRKVEARVQIIGPSGAPIAPDHSMWKIGPGKAFFYSDGSFSLEVPRGRVQITVERGTEYVPWCETLTCEEDAPIALDIPLKRWCDPASHGWHPGNTHVHYKETEKDPDRRLLFDSRAENLRVFAISSVVRGTFKYATNRYPPGRLAAFSDDLHHVQMGEETRHNMGGEHASSLRLLTNMGDPINQTEGGAHTYGFGHVLLLNIRESVLPISRGLLVNPSAPDYPPISYACDEAKNQGGLVIWAHNGHGIECAVASILGKVDALNVWDTYWEDLEYEVWYRLLNCGLKLPASTGSDWFVCSANRVYVKTRPIFVYEEWLEALRRGKSFVTNGPLIDISVNGRAIGETVSVVAGRTVTVTVEWSSYHPLHEVEIIANGTVKHVRRFKNGSASGSFKCDVQIEGDGWVAARAGSDCRDSFDQPIWAHTSPIYIAAGGVVTTEKIAAARWFAQRIDESIAWLSTSGKFENEQQRKEVLELFGLARAKYEQLAR